MITVVGLGFQEDSVTVRGLKRIKSADKVVFRTLNTPSAKNFKNYDSFDRLYDKAENFDELNSMIADEIVKLSEGKDLVYCVDGDGFKDSSVIELKKRTQIDIIPAPIDLAIEPSTACLYLSAYDVSLSIYPDPLVPICVYNIDDAIIASDVKLFLMRFFSSEQEILLVTANSKKTIPLYELDRQRKYSLDTAIYAEKSNNSSFADLLRIMARLTAPDGCPWDKAQSHESIRINLLEEAYETVDAITNNNIDGMIEELGDILLQVVFHADIALRSGEFTLEDVLKRLNEKLIGRHTHIFGGDKADGADGALSVWERNKMKEKGQSTFSASVNDIPNCFPALLRAQKAAKRVEKGGWGRKTLDELCIMLNKNLTELLDAYNKNDKKSIARNLGATLMDLTWIGYKTGGNCEQALLDTVASLQKKYTAFETAVIKDGKDVNALTDEEYNFYRLEAEKIV